MTRRYYEEEMRYLHEAGRVFAETHPEQARYLNVDSVADRDPYVERLFEGFAFLTGRIHEQLEDELPQYTESLCKVLFPHYLRPIPALALLQMRPKSGEVQGTAVLEKGTEVHSEPVGERGVRCRFVTTRAVRLHPIHVQAVDLTWDPDGTTRATLTFRLEDGADRASLALDPLRLHFHAPPPVASAMHLFFTRHVRKVVLRSPAAQGNGGREEEALTLHGQQWVRPGGLADDERLLPASRHTFSGFRLLQEYLAFRPKFWCVDLLGLERFRPAGAANAFQVQVHFDRSYPEEKRFKAENIRLFCTPVVNLFDQDAEPIRVDHRRAQYRVIPSARHAGSVEVYDVRRGVGLEERSGERRAYAPFYTFAHANGEARGAFTASSRVGPTDRRETYVSIESGETPGAESLSLELRCTNGSLPREAIKERMINRLAPEVPKIAEPANLTRPTLIRYPPTEDQFFWKLISHWSLNYRTLASAEALTELLRLYDWTGSDANRRRLAGIRDVTWRPKEIMHRSALLRGAEVVVQIQEGHFADEGDLCLFGLVLSRFLSLYATINSFIHLTIETVPSGNTYQWKPKRGERPLL